MSPVVNLRTPPQTQKALCVSYLLVYIYLRFGVNLLFMIRKVVALAVTGIHDL
jgi:hypothetical protein